MLDLDWERSTPIVDMQTDEIKRILIEYDNTLTVTDFYAIRIGCRNSNYVVGTNKGKFLLRIAPITGLNNESIAYELVKDQINVPDLLFHTAERKASIFIYQYIDGVSLQKLMIESNQCDPSLLEQAARAAAVIHSIPKEKTLELAEFDVPPFEMWYECFLDNPVVKLRIGDETHGRIKRLVFEKQKLIPEIDRLKSLIHCDFRPANMLVDDHRQVFFVDWEAAWWGHSLADIGQLFRYRSFFKDTDIELFEQVYNTYAGRKLPDHWFELSIFRDLVNLLQLLSSQQEAPSRNSDLVNLIEGTLAYWGY